MDFLMMIPIAVSVWLLYQCVRRYGINKVATQVAIGIGLTLFFVLYLLSAMYGMCKIMEYLCGSLPPGCR